MTAYILPDEDIAPWVEPCGYRVDGDLIDGVMVYDYCGKPSVDDDGTPLCAEHLDMAA